MTDALGEGVKSARLDEIATAAKNKIIRTGARPARSSPPDTTNVIATLVRDPITLSARGTGALGYRGNWFTRRLSDTDSILGLTTDVVQEGLSNERASVARSLDVKLRRLHDRFDLEEELHRFTDVPAPSLLAKSVIESLDDVATIGNVEARRPPISHGRVSEPDIISASASSSPPVETVVLADGGPSSRYRQNPHAAVGCSNRRFSDKNLYGSYTQQNNDIISIILQGTQWAPECSGSLSSQNRPYSSTTRGVYWTVLSPVLDGGVAA